MDFLKNKVAWITGASSGIGEALSLEFARHGALLFLSARNMDRLEKVKSQCEDLGAKCLIFQADVCSKSDLELALDALLKHYGKIDILVNNAGISSRGTVAETQMEVYRKVMEVDFFSAIELTKLVLPYMQQEKSGRIITISSLMGKFATPYRSAYCSAKHALHGFFDSLRLEVHQDNIRVQMVCPGFVSTQVAFNALNAQGESRHVNDESNKNGIPPEQFAKILCKKLARNQDEIAIGGKEILGLYLKRLAPKLLNNSLRNYRPK